MKKILLIIIMLLVVPVMAQATEIILSWEAPTENSDGTPLTDLAGFRVYEKASEGVYNQLSDVPVGKTTSSIEKIAGAYCFVVTAYDSSGNESEYSDEACKDLLPPAQVYELRIEIK